MQPTKQPQPTKNPAPADVVTEKNGRRYRQISVRTGAPIWLAAAVWPLAALLLPMYAPRHIVLTAVLSLAVGLLADRLLPREKKLVEIPLSTGIADLDATAAQLSDAMDALDAAREAVSGDRPTAAATLASIGETTGRIRAAILASPDDLPKIRRFLSYYLPVTRKLAEKYVSVTRETPSTGNLAQIAADIESALSTIDASFLRQYDALYSDDALDISTDITVLETMLARDGLE